MNKQQQQMDTNATDESKTKYKENTSKTHYETNVVITKSHIQWNHILLVEGYSKHNIDVFIPQIIMDSVLFFYAKPLVMTIKNNANSKPVFILYCPLMDTYDSLITKIEQIFEYSNTTIELYYGPKSETRLYPQQLLNLSNRFIETQCFVVTILPEDSDVIAALKKIAKDHRRMSSAINDLMQRLPYEDDSVNRSVAETMLKHINDTEDDIELLYTTSEEDDQY